MSRAKPRNSAPPPSATRQASHGLYEEIDLAPLRDSAEHGRQRLCYGAEREASLGALFREIYLTCDESQSFAVYALEQLGYELAALGTLLESEEGRDLNTNIVIRVVAGLEARARAGAEIGKRMLAANEGGAS